MDDIGGEYSYIFNRLNKLEGALKNICRQNTELKEANHKLRLEHDTWQQRENARERVLNAIDNGNAAGTDQAVR